MGRNKNHETLESKRICITLEKPDLKTVRHIAVDLELKEEDIFMFAVKSLIKTYQSIPNVKAKEDLVNKETLRYHEIIERVNQEKIF